ncbi:MAG TPA: DUF6370 family protein [Polyangiaceae bacterium]|nr:DUF6370 family protein [Polyangiaceae bacterium]
MLPRVTMVLAALALALACRAEPGTRISGQTVRVGCAMCIFKMPGVRACLWAVQLDDQYYLAEGALPRNHDAHGPEGMCTLEREAVVDGELIHGKFVASRFDLKPVAAGPATRAPPAHRH